MTIYSRVPVSGFFLSLIIIFCTFLMPVNASETGFKCSKTADQVEHLVCVDQYLSNLDEKLRELLMDAMKMVSESERKEIVSRQQGWIKKRNDCWKYTEPWDCIGDAYRQRIAYFQVEGKKVSFSGPVHYLCNNHLLDKIAATFFRTDPPAVLLERKGRKVIAFLQPSGSGAKYETDAFSEEQVSFWAKGTEAKAAWNENRDIKCIEVSE